MSAAPSDAAQLEKLIDKLIQFNSPKSGEPIPLTEEEVWYLVERATSDLRKGSALAELEPPVVICGDTHGQFSDVIRLFTHGGWPPLSRYLFLGDYVDRGPYSIETMCLMFAFKVRYPSDFYILRGNHETSTINRVYGFYDECKRKYSVRLWFHFQTAFNLLPIAGLVANRIFCMHGGLSPDLHSFDQIRRMTLPFEVPETGGLTADLLWSDPSPTIQGFKPSNRGISYNFGEDVVQEFCKKHSIDLIARAHQVVNDGYEFFAGRRLITIFSAPNYCGEFDNNAGMLNVKENLVCRLKQLKPANRKSRSTRT